MGIETNKIAPSDFTGKDVASLSDTPSADGVTASELKDQFDASSKEVVAVKFNALIDALMGEQGAASIGISGTGTVGNTVAAQIQSIQGQLTGITQGSVADNSITDAKLSAAQGNILDRFSTHASNRQVHLTTLGLTQGAGSAYVVESDAYTGDGLYLLQFHADCTDAPTLTINTASMNLLTTAQVALYAGQILRNGIYILHISAGVCRVLNPESISLYA